MVSKFIGIMLGIALGNYIGSSTPLALASFTAVTGLHMYCNFKSYQSIQIRTFNPYRACKFLTINVIHFPFVAYCGIFIFFPACLTFPLFSVLVLKEASQTLKLHTWLQGFLFWYIYYCCCCCYCEITCWLEAHCQTKFTLKVLY